MVPAASPAHLDHMDRELLASLGEPEQFLRGASRARYRAEAVAVDPGYECELFFPADRACDLAPPTVEFRRTQQIWIRITHLGDIDTARIDVSQQRPAPERIVDHLPLNSHVHQSSRVQFVALAPGVFGRRSPAGLLRRICDTGPAGFAGIGLGAPTVIGVHTPGLAAVAVPGPAADREKRNVGLSEYTAWVSTPVPGRMRARDLDRSHTESVLDAAYAEGQLGADEYHDRIAQVRASKTVGELAALVDDLQAPSALPLSGRPRPVPTARTATAYPSSTRARDADRAAAAELLDLARTEGQITEDEHRAYSDLLGEATMLGDLAELTADLQGHRRTPAPPNRAQPARQGWYLAVLTAAALAVAFGAFALTGREDEPASAEAPVAAAPDAEAPQAGLPAPRPEFDDVEPIVVATPELITGAGMAHFIADYRAEFGDTIADEVSLYPDHGDVDRAIPGQPNRQVSYDYRGGFQRPSDPTTRKVDTPTVDLGVLDTAAIGAALANAAAIAQVPDGKVSHLSVEIHRFPPNEGRMVVAVYVSNTFRESGHFILGPGGEVLRVWPFEG